MPIGIDMDSQSGVDYTDTYYEDDIKKNPLSVSGWLKYIDYKNDATQQVRNSIFERAVKAVPRSYKIWNKYLHELVVAVRGRCIGDQMYDDVNDAFERSLVFLDKMPRIWITYCQFLITQSKVTKTRHTFDRALRALPITQHDRIWELYIKFIRQIGIAETAIRVYRRWLKLEPEKVEDYIEYLVELKAWGEVATQLITILNNDKFISRKGQSKHQLWLQLCELITAHPRELARAKCNIDADAILRSGIEAFKTQAGKLWCGLADYYVQLAQFDKARDIYEEAMATVSTARDFSQIWDSYTMFEDSLLAAQQQLAEDAPEQSEETLAFDLSIARYEHLISRQPFLLSSVLLRQNPHNVSEWHKRVKLYQGQPKMVVETFAKAVATVDPFLAKGKVYSLWAAFAQYYEAHDKIDQARRIFERGVKVEYKTVDDLASLYCEYAEMELRHKNYQLAKSILSRATVSPRRLIHISDSEPVSKRLWKSLKLWTFYVDLEESFGTFLTTKSIYDKMIQLKIVTPQIILNYAEYLEENKYFEDSFRVYENGVALFPFPIVQDIWITYLTKFINRYGGSKLERARDLFEQVIAKVPAKEAKIFYLMYANLEEQFGLARHSMSVYDRATKAVDMADRYNMYLLYINRTTEFYGLTKTREIYTRAIESLQDDKASDMCIRFAEMERKHGEIDRARSIFIHGSQFSDPRTCQAFWKTWFEFEKQHGNEETYAEMSRIKKSVQGQYSQINLAAVEMVNKQKEDAARMKELQNQRYQQQQNNRNNNNRDDNGDDNSSEDEMDRDNNNNNRNNNNIQQQTIVKNSDEIDLDD